MASASSRPKTFLEVTPSFFEGARIVSYDDDGDNALTAISKAAASFKQSSSSDISAHHHHHHHHHQEAALLNRWTCSTCGGLEFVSLDDQRSHFKSDFHRLNVKRKVVGKDPISEEEFEVLAQGKHQRDDDVSSISGSEEEDNDSSDEEITLQGQPSTTSKATSVNRISLLLQSSEEIAAFWKCVVLKDHEKPCKIETTSSSGGSGLVTEDMLLQRLKRFTTRGGLEEKDSWLILLLRGGHFAGCVFDCKSGSILAHKTFHRYVVRAKAGGKQSTKDGTGRAPKSAGASLRRHNEASLQREVRDLLASWKVFIQPASCIFVHAPSRNGHVLFGGEDAPLSRTDERVCNVPITTRRPTFKEARRIFNELMMITFQSITSIQAGDVSNSTGISSKKVLGSSQKLMESSCADGTIKPVYEENDMPDQLVFAGDVVSRESTGSLASVDATIASVPTLLHEATKSGQVDRVLELLEQGVDPCVRDDRGRTPYMLAPDKETRNSFRKFMAAHLEMWDWHAANVPSALTDEMEAAQMAKQAEKDAKRKAKAKEQKKLRKEKQKAKEQTVAASSTTNGKAINQNSATSDDAKKMAEMIEREKRALAAEKRIMAAAHAASSNKSDPQCCSYCGMSLVGLTPFHRFAYQYCTMVCLNGHRITLEPQ